MRDHYERNYLDGPIGSALREYFAFRQQQYESEQVAQTQPEQIPQAFDSPQRRFNPSIDKIDVKIDGPTKLRIKIEPASRADRSRPESPSPDTPHTPTKATPTLSQSLASPHSPSAYTYRIVDHTSTSNPSTRSNAWPASPTKKPSLALLAHRSTNSWSPTVQHTPRPVTLTPEEQHALGFMPLRDDFEVEFDNTAEKELVESIVPSGASLAAHLTASSTSSDSLFSKITFACSFSYSISNPKYCTPVLLGF